MVGLEGMAAGIAVVHCTSNIRANTWKMYGTNSVGGGVGGGEGGGMGGGESGGCHCLITRVSLCVECHVKFHKFCLS